MTDLAGTQDPMPGQLIIDSRREGDSIVLTLRGELDLTSVPVFDRELEQLALRKAGRLVIDLSGLAFMDSTGLRALLQARERATANQHELALRRGPRQVQRVFELTKTDEVFTFEG
jgi:anti-sigma B factor antagonist